VPGIEEQQPSCRGKRESTASSNGDIAHPGLEELAELDGIQLMFDDTTYKNSQGNMFGKHPNKFDIVLPPFPDVSREHCHLTFDHIARLVLVDQSTHNTNVTCNQEGEKKRSKFQ
jgi:hypothetical protein